MRVLQNYEPKEVFHFFEEICSIPHGSRNLQRISDYLVQFAKDRNLQVRQDEALNVIIRKAGTKGYEQAAPVILQGHMDMVAVKVEESTKNLEEEGLELEVDGDFLSAKDTSLGGDDGIAVAYALALLDSKDIPHPPLEVIITTDEEIGLLGAAALDCSDITGRLLINMDSEDEGIFTVSCAGGVTAIGHIPYDTEEKMGTLLKVRLSGFLGGHSGVEINKGRLNSNLTLGRVLYEVREDIRLQSVSGGEKDNAIARFSEAIILVPADRVEAVTEKMLAVMEEIKAEYSTVEKGLCITVEPIEELVENGTITVMDQKSGRRVISALFNAPNGIRRMNPDMPDMVQTSLNIGIVSTDQEKQEVVFSASLRSASATEKKALMAQYTDFFEMLSGYSEMFGDYPGWAYKEDSEIRERFVKAYREIYGEAPQIVAIHAGLECGLFAEKLPGLDAISVGPQMYDIHTTSEKLSISSTARTWELIRKVLE